MEDKLPTTCIDCGTTPEKLAGEQTCKGCGRHLIVCSDGACWPATGMGYQTAGYHEYSLHAPPPKSKFRYRRLYQRELKSGRSLSIFPFSIVISETDEYENGTLATWYPFHLSIRKGIPRLKLNKPPAKSSYGRMLRIVPESERQQFFKDREAKKAKASDP